MITGVDGWTEGRLGDYFRIRHGYAFKGEFFADSGQYIVLTPGNFQAQGGLQERGEREKFYRGKFPPDFLLRTGDMLIVMTDLTQNAPILGSPAIIQIDDRFLHNQRLGKVVDLDEAKMNKSFLYHLLNLPDVRAQIRGSATGSTVRHTAPDRIYAVKVRVPPLPIQRRIASILSAYGDTIENNTRRIKTLEEMAQMIYREWFVNFRFPGHEKVRMVESELGPIPEGWDASPLEFVCNRVTDGSHWSPQTVETGRPMASSKDMHRWGLNLATCRMISDEDFEELVRNDCRPLAGDILITKDGANYLKYCFSVEKDLDVVLLSSVAIIRPDPARASSHYIAFHLSDDDVRTRLGGRVSGAAIPRIVLKDFRHFTILKPPIPIQRRFDHLIQPLVQLCWRLIDKNANLRTTRDLLLPKLISGEISIEGAEETTTELMEEVAQPA